MRWVTLLLVMAGCATTRAQTTLGPPSEPVDYSHVMRIVGRWAWGHACPVEGIVLTAAHNMEPWTEQPFRAVGYTWEDQAGNAGYLTPLGFNWVRDLVAAEATVGTPQFYIRRSVSLEAGDTVYWLEYGEGFKPVEQKAKVLANLAGVVQFDKPPTPGASGTCLFDVEGRVAGVVVWRMRGGSEAEVGGAMSVADPWWAGTQF